MNNILKIILLIAVIAIVVLAVVLLLLPDKEDDRIGVFNISGEKTIPDFEQELIIYPFREAKLGEKQTFSIWVSDEQGVESVVVRVADSIIDLSLAEGDNLKGRWQGSWTIKNLQSGTIPDLIFEATNINQEKAELNTYFYLKETLFNNIVYAAVECFPSGNTAGDSTFLNCLINQNSTVGVDQGNITLSGTITMERGSTLIFEQGQSVYIQGDILKEAEVDGSSRARILKSDVTFVPPTLSLSLSVSPSSGTAPLNGVDFTGNVSGTAMGDIRYLFDCNNTGEYDSDDTVSSDPYTVADLCDYTNPGTYTVRAMAVRQGVSDTDTATVIVDSPPTLSVNLSANPSSGTAPLNDVDLTASVGGTATGVITYEFDCDNDGTYDSSNSSYSTTYTKSDLCDYSTEGTYTARVRVTRQGLVATDTVNINVGAAASGDLSCNSSTETSIILNYSFNNTGTVCIFRGSTRLGCPGSGSGSGTYTVSGLTAGESYNFYLREGYYSSSPLLDSVACTTQDADALGTLTCAGSGQDYIDLDYSFENAGSVYLFRGSTMIGYLGSGTSSGTRRATGLTAGQSYAFYLREGSSSSSPLLDNQTCSTQDPDATGTLSCNSSTQTSITVGYAFDDAEYVYLFRGSTQFGYLGYGSGSGSRTVLGLSPGQSYAFYLRNGSLSSSPLLDNQTCSTQDADASGTLSCDSSTQTSITLNYDFDNAGTVCIFRGSSVLVCPGSGSGSGPYTVLGLSPGQSYTFYLREGYTSSSPLLDNQTCSTQDADASGTLSVASTTENSVTLSYDFDNGTNVSIFRGNTRITTFSGTSGSSTYTDTGRSPGTTYIYYLRNGVYSSSDLLDSATGTTDSSASTLSVNLSANPDSGTAPLNNIDLTASVGGTATGTIIYEFDCDNSGSYDTYNTSSNTMYTQYNLCDYSTAGTHTARVRVTRNGLTATDTVNVSVTTPTPTASGTLTSTNVTSDSATFGYSFNNGTNVSIFRGSSFRINLGSGTDSDSWTDTGLSPNTSYAYYLRNGNTPSATELDSASITTGAGASGSISVQSVGENQITLDYNYSNGTNVSIFRGSSFRINLGSGTDSDSWTDTGLSPNTSYAYYLRNGNTPSATLIDNTTGTTSESCECTSGVCCDGCDYRPSTYVCESNAEVKYVCAGTDCGDDVYRQKKDRYCDGVSSGCNGSLSSWSSPSVYTDCDNTETCSPGSSSCVSCLGPAGDIPSCSDYGVYEGQSIVTGTADSGRILFQNEDGPTYKDDWIEVGVNSVSVNSETVYDVFAWTTEDGNPICLSENVSGGTCIDEGVCIMSVMNTECIYCIVQ